MNHVFQTLMADGWWFFWLYLVVTWVFCAGCQLLDHINGINRR